MELDNGIPVTARMPRELADALERMAREQLTSRSTVVRQLVAKGVAEREASR
jgi:metal-responsive CopG/Arc/MetJ family transcriptional regulator